MSNSLCFFDFFRAGRHSETPVCVCTGHRLQKEVDDDEVPNCRRGWSGGHCFFACTGRMGRSNDSPFARASFLPVTLTAACLARRAEDDRERHMFVREERGEREHRVLQTLSHQCLPRMSAESVRGVRETPEKRQRRQRYPRNMSQLSDMQERTEILYNVLDLTRPSEMNLPRHH